MPIPTPTPTEIKKESKNEFISRCMGDSIMVKDYEQKQRAAVCYQKWNDRKKKAKAVITAGTDETAFFWGNESIE